MQLRIRKVFPDGDPRMHLIYAKKTTRRDLVLGLIHWDLSVRLGMPLRFLFRQKRVDCEKKSKSIISVVILHGCRG